MKKPQAILLVLLFAAPVLARAQGPGPFLLTSVHVEGSKHYGEAEIVRAAGLKAGQSATPDTLKAAVDKIGSLGVFAQVSYRYATRGNTMTAVITVQDATAFLPCSFENLVWFTPQELLQGLRTRVPLFDGTVPASGRMVDLVSAQLVAMLEARGLHAQVFGELQGAMGGPVRGMQFKETGIPIPVVRIQFTGVQKVDAALLQDAGRPLLNKDYDATIIRDFSRGGIAAVYRQRGYLRATFGAPLPQLITGDPTPNAVAVTITVTEGEQFRLKEVTWSGDSVIPYSDLAKTLHVKPGSPLDAVQLEQDVYSLILLYHPKGYLQADARPNTILDDATLSAMCQIFIRQGDLFRMGKLEIAGLDDGNSLAGLSRLRPGDPYDATYWGRFNQEIAPRLPRTGSAWRMKLDQAIHPDTKTVDIKLTFTPAPKP